MNSSGGDHDSVPKGKSGPALSFATAGVSLMLGCVLFVMVGGPVPATLQNAAVQPVVGSGIEIRQTGSNTLAIGHVELDKLRRTVSIPAKVRIRNEVVEYALVTEEGKGYESIFTTEAKPSDIHVACLLLGAGSVALTGAVGQSVVVPETNSVQVDVTWCTNGQIMHLPLSACVQLTSGRADPSAPSMHFQRWIYNGSLVTSNGFAAQREGSIVSLIRDPVALINNPEADRDNDDIHFANSNLLPPQGTLVSLILTLHRPHEKSHEQPKR